MVTLQKIEAFFNDNNPGEDPVKLDQCTTITNPRAFVISTIYGLKANKTKEEKKILKPYFDRLQKLYKLKSNK